jgi:hypothetical protein
MTRSTGTIIYPACSLFNKEYVKQTSSGRVKPKSGIIIPCITCESSLRILASNAPSSITALKKVTANKTYVIGYTLFILKLRTESAELKSIAYIEAETATMEKEKAIRNKTSGKLNPMKYLKNTTMGTVMNPVQIIFARKPPRIAHKREMKNTKIHINERSHCISCIFKGLQ